MREVTSPCEAESRSVVAAFDFDGTLTQGDTLLPFLRRSLGLPRFIWALCLSGPWLAGFALRLVSNHRAKARLLQVSLAGLSQHDAQAQAQAFITDYLPTRWCPWGMAQLLQHQQMGHRCIIVSASPGLYLHEIGKSLGIKDVLCTEMQLTGTRYTGLMATPNCHGEEKVRRLKNWLAVEMGAHAAPVLHAYGDTSGDQPMLRLANVAWYRQKPWSDVTHKAR